jgi:putative ABC transport system substrate-binding protein
VAAKQATGSLPIVAADLETDPVAAGFVASVARPGGRITGLFLDLPGLTSKWLPLIRDIVPDAQRIAVLWQAPTGPYQLHAIIAAAQSVSIETQVLECGDNNGLEAALNSGRKRRPQALIQPGSPIINNAGKQIAECTAKHRLPGMSQFRSFPDRGGLMSYGPNLSILFRRVTPYIGNILKGAKPGELPVELPTHFEVIVNRNTAKAMGITIPQSLLLRADEVIQ